jgi:cob(I)alamin adenosyltransferase
VYDVVAALKSRRHGLHVILTGRAAPAELAAAADLVTEMSVVKHPYREGMAAQKGIEF